jgi:hypothetical protein
LRHDTVVFEQFEAAQSPFALEISHPWVNLDIDFSNSKPTRPVAANFGANTGTDGTQFNSRFPSAEE